MSQFPITLKPFGKTAILIEWPKRVDEAVLKHILTYQHFLKTKLEDSWEMIPAYNSLTLINSRADFDYQEMRDQLFSWYKMPKPELPLKQHLWKLPVCYDLEFGIDLEAVAQALLLPVPEVILKHTSHVYTVYGIGFLPGFMYLGGLPNTLEIKRKKIPRLSVAKGSVGLAGKQTGIYPQDSPGGWNIIGRCPVPLFNPNAADPCFASVGDKIQFIPIERAEYELHKIEAEVGIYTPEKEEFHA